VIVDNKPGAGTNIANEYVARSAPDGYTLPFNSPAVAINMSLTRNPPYDALRDFAAVSVISESTNILVVPASLPVNSPRELVALARAKPGSLNYSSAGNGTTQHLAAELFKLRTGTSIVHVPYRGSAPSIAALMPEVPTLKEAGIEGVEVPLWFGMLAPAATPREIVSTLSAAVAKAAHDPDTRKRLAEQGAEPVGSSCDEFGKLLRDEVAKWAEVVRVSGARAD
jgi:tripartite-type tricarboxylate transporter receptor subunit TctC